ncbi:MAG: toprim domain-containing protein, partial [Planctomycetota bacterium]
RRGEDGSVYETFRNRLMFPIRDATGRVVGFGGRTLGDDRAKYLNTRETPLFDKGRQLYGIDLAREAVRAAGRVVVVEGYTDCIAAHQAGIGFAVATLGTALTDRHVSLLKRYADEIVLLFDSDRAGEAAAERAIRVAVPACVTVKLVRLPEGEDPCAFIGRSGSDAFEGVLKEAVDALEFKWRQTRRRFAADGSESRRREALMDFLSVVAEATASQAVDAIQEGLLVNQVAHLLRMEREEVAALLRRLAKRTGSSRGTGARRASAEPPVRPAGDREQSAWVQVLEVLLNEPGLISLVEEFPDVSRITDERDRRIARRVVELAPQEGADFLSDVLAGFTDPGDVERITTLAQRGERRGNYEETLRAALMRIARAVADERLEEAKSKLAEVSGGEEAKEDADDPRSRLASVHAALRARKAYVPRRLARRVSVVTDVTTQDGEKEYKVEQR